MFSHLFDQAFAFQLQISYFRLTFSYILNRPKLCLLIAIQKVCEIIDSLISMCGRQNRKLTSGIKSSKKVPQIFISRALYEYSVILFEMLKFFWFRHIVTVLLHIIYDFSTWFFTFLGLILHYSSIFSKMTSGHKQ